MINALNQIPLTVGFVVGAVSSYVVLTSWRLARGQAASTSPTSAALRAAAVNVESELAKFASPGVRLAKSAVQKVETAADEFGSEVESLAGKVKSEAEALVGKSPTVSKAVGAVEAAAGTVAADAKNVASAPIAAAAEKVASEAASAAETAGKTATADLAGLMGDRSASAAQQPAQAQPSPGLVKSGLLPHQT
jgi:hypothetical protein